MIQSDDNIAATHSQIQTSVSEWEDLIRITGCCLVPDKSAWYLVYYKWRQGKWKCTNPGKDKFLKATNKTRKICFSLIYLDK